MDNDLFQFSDPAEAQRAEIVRENKNRSALIIEEHKDEGATASAIFIPQQLPPLDPSKRPYSSDAKPQIQVVNSDTFIAARAVMDAIGDDARCSTAVLNLASDQYPPGGGYTTLAIAQEECLCYSSTLYHTLTPLNQHYPWPNKGPGCIKGIYSPGVVIFRGPLYDSSTNEFCPELPPAERKVLSVITVAAPRSPLLTPDRSDFENPNDKEDLREKVRLILRIAGSNGQKYLILGAMGCGAYLCPPVSVAREMKSVLEEPEFAGWFKSIVFAVYSSASIGHGNFDIFKQAFQG